MKNFYRACAALSLTACLMAPAAHADTTDLIRNAQMDLGAQGYYVGRYDGTMGPVTRAAIMDYQRTHGLTQTGELDATTYNMVTAPQKHSVSAYNTGYYGYTTTSYYPVGYAPIYVAPTAFGWDGHWAYTRTQQVFSRYGHLDVHEDDRGSVRHYVVTYNGHAVLFANNQPGILRASQTFQMDNKDAIIFTAFQGDGVCAYKNYLLTLNNDGSFNNPREIGNCGGNYEAHVADNALFISFTDGHVAGNVNTWDVWRYEDEALVHL